MKFEISNLQNFPLLKPVVTNRIWKAWWEPKGCKLQVISDFIESFPATRNIPFGLVAYENGNYVGSVLGIISDLELRPALTPWVAALWVDPAFRKHGVATALMKATLTEISALGNAKAYLCATAEKRSFYKKFGWQLIEERVGGDALDVFEIQSNYTVA
ncbi:MAG: GNAT family N-acetyltransferase [Aestuariivirga sp.]